MNDLVLAIIRNRFAAGAISQTDRDNLREALASAAELEPPYGDVLRWSLNRVQDRLDHADLHEAAHELQFAHNVPGLGSPRDPTHHESYFLEAVVHGHIEEHLAEHEAAQLKSLLGSKWRDPVPFGEFRGDAPNSPLNLLILRCPPRRAGTEAAWQYRGTQRSRALFPDSGGGESGVLRDLGKAIQYAKLLNVSGGGSGGRYELIEVVRRGAEPQAGMILFGFDLSDGLESSLIAQGLVPPMNAGSAAFHAYQNVSARYVPTLNEYGLLPFADTATECLTELTVLIDRFPGLLPSGGYEVVGIYWVTP